MVAWTRCTAVAVAILAAGFAADSLRAADERIPASSLIASLRSPDRDVRRDAARRLASTDENLGPFALELATALRDDDETVRLEILHAVRHLGRPGLLICRATLQYAAETDPSEHVALRAAELLRRNGLERPPAWLFALENGAAAKLLPELEEIWLARDKAGDELTAAQEARDVRRLAAIGRTIVEDSRLALLVVPLLTALDRFGEDGRLSAVQVRFLTSAGPIARPDLAPSSAETSVRQRTDLGLLRRAADTVKDVETRHVLAGSLLAATLHSAAAHPSDAASAPRNEIAHAVGRAGVLDVESVRLIRLSLADAPEIREALLEGLIERTESAASARLASAPAGELAGIIIPLALHDPSSRPRSLAVLAAARLFPDHPCLPDVVVAALQTEKNLDVRRQAVACLAELRDPPAEALPAVIELLETDRSGAGQVAAFRALRRIAGDDPALAPKLNELEKSMTALQTVSELSDLIEAQRALRDDVQRERRASLLHDLANRRGNARP